MPGSWSSASRSADQAAWRNGAAVDIHFSWFFQPISRLMEIELHLAWRKRAPMQEQDGKRGRCIGFINLAIGRNRK
jgi:hypothetical protein